MRASWVATDEEKLAKAIIAKRPWLYAKLRERAETGTPRPPREFVSGKLNIHWATMQLPPDLIDYVLVHELAHVRHPDHGPDFWRTVERPLPDFAARRARLRLTGSALWLPGGNA